MSSDPGFHHPRHIAEWLWLEQVLKPAEVELPEKELVSPTEPESPPEEELAPEPAESPIPEESEDEEETEPEDSEQTPAREAGLTEGGGDDDSPEGESGMPSAARKHSITALPQLEDTLAYSRALHRVIPLRAVPGSQEIDVHATVQRSAASGGVIDPVVVEKSERRGHLIIIEAGSLSFDPWRASIEKLADLARTVGSFRDVQMIRLPLPSGGAEQPGLPQDEQNSDPQSKALDELSMALRPGRPTLVLLAHDGVDDSIEDGQLGHYLDQQVRRIDREARIAWLHPWPEMQWSHTAVEGLFRRGLTSQIDGELVLPVIPLGLKRAGLAPLDHPRPGLAHLEGWLDGQGMIGVPAYGVPILDEDAVQDTSTIDDDFPLDEEFADEVAEEGDEEPDWEDVFQRFVSSTTEEAARMLGAAAAASVVSSLSIPFLEVICAVNDKTVATSAEDSRFAVASAITSGFFERASRPPGQVGSDDAPNKDDEMPRLRFCGKSKEVIRQHLTPETVGRVLHSLKDQSFTDPAGIDLRDEIHWKLLSRLTGEDDLPEGTEIGPSIDPDHFRWAAMLLNHEAEQIDTWIETDITPGTKKVPVAIVDGPTGESEVTDPIVEPDAAEEDRFENWDMDRLCNFIEQQYMTRNAWEDYGSVDVGMRDLESIALPGEIDESGIGNCMVRFLLGHRYEEFHSCVEAYFKLHGAFWTRKWMDRYLTLIESGIPSDPTIHDWIESISASSSAHVTLELPNFKKTYDDPDPLKNLDNLHVDLVETVIPEIMRDRLNCGPESPVIERKNEVLFGCLCAFLRLKPIQELLVNDPDNERIPDDEILEPLLRVLALYLADWGKQVRFFLPRFQSDCRIDDSIPWFERHGGLFFGTDTVLSKWFAAINLPNQDDTLWDYPHESEACKAHNINGDDPYSAWGSPMWFVQFLTDLLDTNAKPYFKEILDLLERRPQHKSEYYSIKQRFGRNQAQQAAPAEEALFSTLVPILAKDPKLVLSPLVDVRTLLETWAGLSEHERSRYGWFHDVFALPVFKTLEDLKHGEGNPIPPYLMPENHILREILSASGQTEKKFFTSAETESFCDHDPRFLRPMLSNLGEDTDDALDCEKAENDSVASWPKFENLVTFYQLDQDEEGKSTDESIEDGELLARFVAEIQKRLKRVPVAESESGDLQQEWSPLADGPTTVEIHRDLVTAAAGYRYILAGQNPDALTIAEDELWKLAGVATKVMYARTAQNGSRVEFEKPGDPTQFIDQFQYDVASRLGKLGYRVKSKICDKATGLAVDVDVEGIAGHLVVWCIDSSVTDAIPTATFTESGTKHPASEAWLSLPSKQFYQDTEMGLAIILAELERLGIASPLHILNEKRHASLQSISSIFFSSLVEGGLDDESFDLLLKASDQGSHAATVALAEKWLEDVDFIKSWKIDREEATRRLAAAVEAGAFGAKQLLEKIQSEKNTQSESSQLNMEQIHEWIEDRDGWEEFRWFRQYSLEWPYEDTDYICRGSEDSERFCRVFLGQRYEDYNQCVQAYRSLQAVAWHHVALAYLERDHIMLLDAATEEEARENVSHAIDEFTKLDCFQPQVHLEISGILSRTYNDPDPLKNLENLDTDLIEIVIPAIIEEVFAPQKSTRPVKDKLYNSMCAEDANAWNRFSNPISLIFANLDLREMIAHPTLLEQLDDQFLEPFLHLANRALSHWMLHTRNIFGGNLPKKTDWSDEFFRTYDPFEVLIYSERFDDGIQGETGRDGVFGRVKSYFTNLDLFITLLETDAKPYFSTILEDLTLHRDWAHRDRSSFPPSLSQAIACMPLVWGDIQFLLGPPQQIEQVLTVLENHPVITEMIHDEDSVFPRLIGGGWIDLVLKDTAKELHVALKRDPLEISEAADQVVAEDRMMFQMGKHPFSDVEIFNDPRLHQPMMVPPGKSEDWSPLSFPRKSHFAGDDFQHIPKGEHSFLLKQAWKAARLGIRYRNSTDSHQATGKKKAYHQLMILAAAGYRSLVGDRRTPQSITRDEVMEVARLGWFLFKISPNQPAFLMWEGKRIGHTDFFEPIDFLENIYVEFDESKRSGVVANLLHVCAQQLISKSSTIDPTQPWMQELQDGAENEPSPLNRLRQQAEAGDAKAMLELAKQLLSVDAFDPQIEEGCSWLRKAAEEEDPDAMRELGIYLHVGLHFSGDREEGVFWLRKAADAGDLEAKRKLVSDLNRNDHKNALQQQELLDLHFDLARSGDQQSMEQLVQYWREERGLSEGRRVHRSDEIMLVTDEEALQWAEQVKQLLLEEATGDVVDLEAMDRLSSHLAQKPLEDAEEAKIWENRHIEGRFASIEGRFASIADEAGSDNHTDSFIGTLGMLFIDPLRKQAGIKEEQLVDLFEKWVEDLSPKEFVDGVMDLIESIGGRLGEYDSLTEMLLIPGPKGLFQAAKDAGVETVYELGKYLVESFGKDNWREYNENKEWADYGLDLLRSAVGTPEGAYRVSKIMLRSFIPAIDRTVGSASALPGLLRGTSAEARQLLEKAASQGYVPAMGELAERFHSGKGSDFHHSPADALKWTCVAAETLDPESLLKLGVALNDRSGADHAMQGMGVTGSKCAGQRAQRSGLSRGVEDAERDENYRAVLMKLMPLVETEKETKWQPDEKLCQKIFDSFPDACAAIGSSPSTLRWLWDQSFLREDEPHRVWLLRLQLFKDGHMKGMSADAGWYFIQVASDLGSNEARLVLARQGYAEGNYIAAEYYFTEAKSLSALQGAAMTLKQDRPHLSFLTRRWLTVFRRRGVTVDKQTAEYLASEYSGVRSSEEIKEMGHLGHALLSEDSLSRNRIDGEAWLREAAEQHDHDSILNLSERLLKGDGVDQDADEGQQWAMKLSENLAEHSLDNDDPFDDYKSETNPFWSLFLARGVALHPELEGKIPHGGKDGLYKIGPLISPGVNLRVSRTDQQVYCTLHVAKRERLGPILADREAFEEEVGVPKKWDGGSKSYFGISILPADKKEQATWSPEKQAQEILTLYGRIKHFVLSRISEVTEAPQEVSPDEVTDGSDTEDPQSVHRQGPKPEPLTLGVLKMYIWSAADLNPNCRPGELFEIIFGLLLLKSASDRSSLTSDQIGSGLSSLTVPRGAHWSGLRNLAFHSGPVGLTGEFSKSMDELAAANPGVMDNCREGIFLQIHPEKCDEILAKLIPHFERHRLCEADFTSPDLLGTAFEYFLGRWAVESQFDALLESYSPRGLVRLMVQLLDPQNGESIHDPVCGTGGMLLESYKHVRSVAGENSICDLSGQELVASTAMISQWNHLFHGLQSTIKTGDSLLEPAYYDRQRGTHQQFDCVLGAIPFGVKEWGFEQWEDDNALGRDQHGMPPRGRGEFAFIGHMMASMKRSANGRMAVAVPIGVLFGLGSDIRNKILEEDLIEAVIHLPVGLLPHTNAPLAVVIFRHEKPAERRGKVLFISAEDEYIEERRKRHLGPDNIEKIVQCYQKNGLDTEESGGQEDQWTQQEIGASVKAYLNMLQEEVSGRQFNKAEMNRKLRKGVLNRRSRGSVEMRMCNISTVLRDHGKRFIDGYKPLENVGTNVYLRIQHALIQSGFPIEGDSMSLGLDQLKHHVVTVEEIMGADAPLDPCRYIASESNLFFDEVCHLATNEHPELSSREISRSSVTSGSMRSPMASGISCELRWLDGMVIIELMLLDGKLAHHVDHSPFEFRDEVAIPTKWEFNSESGKVHLFISVSLTDDAEQKDWAVEKKANEALELYGRIKKFVRARISSTDSDGEEN